MNNQNSQRQELSDKINVSSKTIKNIVLSSFNPRYHSKETLIDSATGEIIGHLDPKEVNDPINNYTVIDYLRLMGVILKETFFHPKAESDIDLETLEVTREY